MKDSLGASLEEICKVVPGGALVFFPSYNLLEKLCTRWVQTGQWSCLNAQKCLFVGESSFLCVLACNIRLDTSYFYASFFYIF